MIRKFNSPAPKDSDSVQNIHRSPFTKSKRIKNAKELLELQPYPFLPPPQPCTCKLEGIAYTLSSDTEASPINSNRTEMGVPTKVVMLFLYFRARLPLKVPPTPGCSGSYKTQGQAEVAWQKGWTSLLAWTHQPDNLRQIRWKTHHLKSSQTHLFARFALGVLCLGWMGQKGLPRNERLTSKLTKNFPRQPNHRNDYWNCTC